MFVFITHNFLLPAPVLFVDQLIYLPTTLYLFSSGPHKNISRVGEPIQATQAGQIQLFLEGDGGWVGGGKYHPFVFHISYVPVCCSCDNLQPLRVDSTLIYIILFNSNFQCRFENNIYFSLLLNLRFIGFSLHKATECHPVCHDLLHEDLWGENNVI